MMSKIHVLDKPDPEHVHVALHFRTMDGENDMGTSWRDVLAGMGLLRQHGLYADPVERQQIMAGDIVEISVVLPDEENGNRIRDLHAEAEAEIARWKAAFILQYAFYGYEYGEVE